MSLLMVERLDVRHGLLQAVREVSFKVQRGAVVAFVGANGAGKTTLFRSLAGAHLPVGGQVIFSNSDVTRMPDHQRVRRGVALVPEGRRLFGEMTVRENLQLAAAINRPGPWTLEAVLDAFPNLAGRINSKAASLSGGEQQATAIGRALMTNPELLLLDEVSLGLSPAAVDRVYESLQKLIATGTTILLVEQDLNRARAVADHIICMLEGEISAEGKTSEMTRDKIMAAYFGLNRMHAAKARI